LSGLCKNTTRGIVTLAFRPVAKSDPASVSREAIAIQWQPVAKLDSIMEPVYAQRLTDARRQVWPVVKAHEWVQSLDQVEDP